MNDVAVETRALVKRFGRVTALGGAAWLLAVGVGAASAALLLMRRRELKG